MCHRYDALSKGRIWIRASTLLRCIDAQNSRSLRRKTRIRARIQAEQWISEPKADASRYPMPGEAGRNLGGEPSRFGLPLVPGGVNTRDFLSSTLMSAIFSTRCVMAATLACPISVSVSVRVHVGVGVASVSFSPSPQISLSIKRSSISRRLASGTRSGSIIKSSYIGRSCSNCATRCF